jgi:predicted permease
MAVKRRPPRVARAILFWLTPSVERRWVLGDLLEEYELVERESGEARARGWYRRQVLHSIWPLAWRRLQSSGPQVGVALRRYGGELAADVRHGLRVAAKTPLITLSILLTLALSAGALTAIWVVAHGVWLRPFPFAESARLMHVVEGRGRGNIEVSLPVLESWRSRSSSFEAMAGFATSAVTLVDDTGPERVRAAVVTEGFIALLGVQPVLGRGFEAKDHGGDRPEVVLLGHAFWQERYSGDAGVIGRDIEIDERRVKVAGVLPDFGFAFPRRGEDVWLPVTAAPGTWQASRRTQWLTVLGRQRAGVTPVEASRELAELAPGRRDNGNVSRARFGVRQLREEIVGGATSRLTVLGLALGMLVLMALVNLALLMTAWGHRRSGEYALRSVLGGGGRRIQRQVLTEALLLAAAGGLLGVLVAAAGVRLLSALYPGGLPRSADASPAGVTLLVALVAALVVIVLASVPALMRAARRDVGRGFQDGWATSAKHTRRARSALVVTQLAMSVALLTGGLLLVQQFRRLARTDPGFRTTGILTFHVQPSALRYRSDEAIDRLYAELVQSLRTVRGVEAVGTVSYLPFRGSAESERVRATASARGAERPASRADVRAVRGDYFTTLGARLLAGRWFDELGDDSRRRVAVINTVLADRLFADGEAVGRHIELDDRNWEVVGVVANIRSQLSGRPRGEVYVPGARADENAAVIVVRTDASTPAILPAVQDAVYRLDPSLALADVATMDRRIRDSMATQRFHATLLGGISLLALLLAATGVYGLVGHTVRQRSREIGIRKALGEPGHTVFGRVMGWALKVAATGLVLGTLLALTALEWFDDVVTEVSERDAGILIQVPLLLLAVTLIAAWIPALRAGRVDPMITMKE